MDYLLFPLKICFLLVVAVYAQDNIIQIEFRRISDSRPDKPQIETELLVDYLSNDTFQIMCKLNDVNQLNTLIWLILWHSDGTLQINLQNEDPSKTESYRKPTFYSNVTRWTAAGRFDNLTRNSRNTTLGVSRPVSSFTCSDARMYKCTVHYITSGMVDKLRYTQKQLKVRAAWLLELWKNFRGKNMCCLNNGPVKNSMPPPEIRIWTKMTPSKITKQIFDASGDVETLISELTNTTTIIHVGQKLRLQCRANIGSFNSSVKIVWMKSSLDNSIELVPFTPGKQIVGEPKASGSCEFEKTDSVLYDVSLEDALRTSGNRFHFQCYVHIMSIDWKTPEQHRPNFSFVVHMNGDKTKAEVFTGISVFIGDFCALVILGSVGIFLKRKFSNLHFPKADEKSEEISPRPDKTNTDFPLARVIDTSTEIDCPLYENYM